jgi:hypothetical protein
MQPAMSTELPTFSKAFAVTRDLPLVHLLGRHGSTFVTEHQAKRQIERWQTKSLARALLEAWGVTTAYQLEKELAVLQPKVVFPDERPRLFDRMLFKGEPWIGKELAKSTSLAAIWVGKALSRAPKALDVLTDQVWRLLDPTPMQHVDWTMITEALMPRKIAWMETGGQSEILMIKCPLSPGSAEVMEYFVPRIDPKSLWGLLLVLLQLRRWEISGNLVAYYLQLLEAFERCVQPAQSPDLSIITPQCPEFLAACFGRVHIGPTHKGNVEFQIQRINAARKEFENARGSLRSGVPEVDWN